MAERDFKKIGKLEFSVQVPMDSDLMVAVKLATEKRDKSLEEFDELIKQGATMDDKENVGDKIEAILKMNENIKVMEDAAIAVRMYKLEEQKKPETNG